MSEIWESQARGSRLQARSHVTKRNLQGNSGEQRRAQPIQPKYQLSRSFPQSTEAMAPAARKVPNGSS